MKMSQERQFGFFVAVILLGLGLWRLHAGGDHADCWIVGAIGLAAVTALFPCVWLPVLRVWMPIAHALGWINARIILGAVFFVLITPIGWLLRMSGHDPLRLRSQQGGSDWVKRGEEWPPASFKDPF